MIKRKEICLSKVYAFFLYSILLLISGCTEDDWNGGATPTTTIILNVQEIPPVNINTRAAIYDKVVEEALVMIIRNNSLVVESVTPTTQVGDKLSFTLKRLSPKLGEKLYVFCNTGALESSMHANSEEQLFRLLTCGNPLADISDKLVMYGETIVEEGAVSIDMKSLFAKATLSAPGFTIEQWEIRNLPTTQYIARDIIYPIATPYNGSANPDDNDATYFIPRIDNQSTTDPKTCLLTKIKDKGWYRLDFYQNDSYIDLMRIHYIFNIRKINNDGYSTPEEALANPGSNILYDLEVSENYSVTNGQYSLLLDREVIRMYPDADYTARMAINVSALIPDASITNITTYNVKLNSPNNQVELVAEVDKDGTVAPVVNSNANLKLTDKLTTENSKREIKLIVKGADLKDTYLEFQLGNITRQIPIEILTSNCYLADFSKSNQLFIPVDRANIDGVSRIAKESLDAKLIWTDQPGIDLTAIYEMDQRWIKVTGSNFTGNAVIAAINSSGIIRWSWHIWSLDGSVIEVNPVIGNYTFKSGATDNFNDLVWMDRNLGAYNLIDGSSGSRGLVYQWGRKDPFPGGADDMETEPTLYTSLGRTFKMSGIHPDYGNCFVDHPSVNNLEYSIEHPINFIKGTVSIGLNPPQPSTDWLTDGTDFSQIESFRNYLWINKLQKKGYYNPCPIGWSLPNGDGAGPWGGLLYKNATIDNYKIEWTGKGKYFFAPYRSVIGSLISTNEKDDNSRWVYYYWGNITDYDYESTQFLNFTIIHRQILGGRAYGNSLRCVQESED